MRRVLLTGLILFCSFSITSASAEENAGKGEVYVFVDTVCPIANAYLPELGRIAEEFEKDGFGFTLVYPDKSLSREKISKHLQEYECRIPAQMDLEHKLVRKAGATTTPEVAVFDAAGTLCYRGRIDNLFTDLGDRRRQATEFYLRDVLAKLRNHGTVEFSETPPVGCIIEPLQ